MIQHPATDRVVLALQRTLGATEPLDALRALVDLRAQIDAYEYARVRQALDDGLSFGEIGRALGISRQAAHRRYRTPTRSRTAVSEGVRAVLAAARVEAARAGASEIECEHVALALAVRGELTTRRIDLDAARVLVATGRAGGTPPAKLGGRLRTLLTDHGVPVDVDALRRILPEDPAASRILERLQA